MSITNIRRVMSHDDIYCLSIAPEKNTDESKLELTDIVNRVFENNPSGIKSIRKKSCKEKFSFPKKTISEEMFTHAFRKPYLYPHCFACEIPWKGISFDNKIPQIDDQWAPFTAKLIIPNQAGQQINIIESIYPSTAEFHERAQILLNRFFMLNPSFLEEKYQFYYPYLILTALNVTFKVEEDHGVNNKYFFKALYSSAPIEQLKQFLHTELVFLEGIGWNVNTDLSVKNEMKGLLLHPPLDQAEINTFFINKAVGSYVIQEEESDYVVTIKIDMQTIQSHRFTFEKEHNTLGVRVISLPDKEKPRFIEHLLNLITEWGGINPITRDINQDLLRSVESINTLNGSLKGSFIIEKINTKYRASIKADSYQGRIYYKHLTFSILNDGRSVTAIDPSKNEYYYENDYITLIQKYGGTKLVR